MFQKVKKVCVASSYYEYLLSQQSSRLVVTPEVRRYDPLKGFRLKDFSLYPSKAPWEKFEVADLYVPRHGSQYTDEKIFSVSAVH